MTIRSETHTVLEVREWAGQGGLYAILDSCDTPSVLEKVRELGGEFAVSLYRGSAEEQFESFAPYLVVVDIEVFDWIVETLWSVPWGVFARSHVELAALRTHFRKFLMVKSPEGEDWYFRFYDPRVLNNFLPTCTKEELSDFFGPVSKFALSDLASSSLVVLTHRFE